MAADRHIIHRLVLDIEVPDKTMADQVADRVVHLLYHDLLPKLEKFFDGLAISRHLLIDKLALDLGKMQTDQLEGFPEKLIEALHVAMETPETRQKEQSEQLLSKWDKAFRTFIYFLETGKLPWHIAAEMQWLNDERMWLELLRETVEKEVSNRRILRQLLYRSTMALHRLLNQFTPFFVSRMIEILKNRPVGSLQIAGQTFFNRFIQQIQFSGIAHDTTKNMEYARFETFFLMLVFYDQSMEDEVPAFQLITDLADGRANIADAIKEIKSLGGNREKMGEHTPTSIEQDRDESRDNGLFIRNGGLVILHPFVHYFFKGFGLVTGTEFTDGPARQLAVHLLHYLATGNTEPTEYDLSFEKFLCNWPDEQPIERFVSIPQGMLDEADNLLKTAIGHWKALKNTSPDGLREGFLTRPGKLVTTDEPAILYIEKSTIDILLSSLPWGLGVIKLPWMPRPFYVNWQ